MVDEYLIRDIVKDGLNEHIDAIVDDIIECKAEYDPVSDEMAKCVFKYIKMADLTYEELDYVLSCVQISVALQHLADTHFVVKKSDGSFGIS